MYQNKTYPVDPETLNSIQNKYYIINQLDNETKNPIFIGIERNYTKNNCMTMDDKKIFIIKLIEIGEDYSMKDFAREKNIIDMFYHFSEIIKYEPKVNISIQDKSYILIPTPYYPLSDLYNYLSYHQKYFDPNLICQFAFKSLQILKLLKSYNVVHNDIKLENFIVKSANPFDIILIDFESSQIINSNKKSDIFGGTYFFQSPETLKKQPHDYSADMWSLAVTLYMIFFGEYPFNIDENDKEDEILNKISNNKLCKLDDDISDEAWEFLLRALEIDPDNRLTVEDALRLDWFSSIYKDDTKSNYDDVDFNVNLVDEIRA